MARIRSHIKIISCIWLLVISNAGLCDDANREYKIKAAYLYNLIKFINWPNTHEFENNTTNICIYGNNPFLGHLDKLESRTAKSRNISIHIVAHNNSLSHCDMTFIGNKNPLPKLKYKQTLYVGESKDFVHKYGVISLIVAKNSVQLHVNHSRAKELGFSISANLLEVAVAVK